MMFRLVLFTVLLGAWGYTTQTTGIIVYSGIFYCSVGVLHRIYEDSEDLKEHDFRKCDWDEVGFRYNDLEG